MLHLPPTDISAPSLHGVNAVMIVVEFIEGHPPPDDAYRPVGS
jgi:hypothetical protein